MHGDQWQLQEAKQRFSELIRSVETEGPQVVTRLRIDRSSTPARVVDMGEGE